MDPNTALAELLAALNERNTEDARDRFEALADWIDNGGFLPVNLAELADKAADSALNASLAAKYT